MSTEPRETSGASDGQPGQAPGGLRGGLGGSPWTCFPGCGALNPEIADSCGVCQARNPRLGPYAGAVKATCAHPGCENQAGGGPDPCSRFCLSHCPASDAPPKHSLRCKECGSAQIRRKSRLAPFVFRCRACGYVGGAARVLFENPNQPKHIIEPEVQGELARSGWNILKDLMSLLGRLERDGVVDPGHYQEGGRYLVEEAKAYLAEGERPEGLRITPIPVVGQNPGLARAWRAAEALAAAQQLELHTDAAGFPVLVVPKTFHPVRPEESPVPGQRPGAIPTPDHGGPHFVTTEAGTVVLGFGLHAGYQLRLTETSAGHVFVDVATPYGATLLSAHLTIVRPHADAKAPTPAPDSGCGDPQ